MPRPLTLLVALAALILAGRAPRAQGGEPLAAAAPEAAPFDRAAAAFEAGRTEEAIRLYEEAVHREPRRAEARYALALAYAASGPAHDEGRAARALESALRIEPRNARYLAARLDALRRTTPEAKAYSMTDARRPSAARRLLEANPASALAHEELALHALLEFGWRRGRARRGAGEWDAATDRGMSGGANRARRRALRHLEAALAAEPGRAAAHRLRLRLAALAGDTTALAEAAEAYLAARPDDADAWLFAGLAAHRQHHLALADGRFARALEAMSPEDRHSATDVRPFLRAGERAAWTADSLGTPPDSSALAATFWRARDPRLLTPQNERRLEHLARLALADLLFRDARAGRRGWTSPRGRTFVRYGPPDDDVQWLADDHIAKAFGQMERWAYGGPDGFVLTFEDAFRGDEFDFASSSAGEDDATRARSLAPRQPERYAYRPPGRFVQVPVLASAFRGAGGRTELLVAYGLPLDVGVEAARGPLGVESGAFLVGAEGQTAAEARRATAAPAPGAVVALDTLSLWTDALALTAEPGVYTLAVEVEQGGSRAVGLTRRELTLPDFGRGRLAVSDLVLASSVEERAETRPGEVRRGAYALRPQPLAAFPVGAPIPFYAEVYGLALRDGRTAYEVEALLRPRDEAGGLGRLARRVLGRFAPSGVALRFEGGGTTPDDALALALDAAGQPPGPYTLTLRLRDAVTGATAETSRALTLD